MFRALLGLLLLCAGSSAHSARAAAAPGALTVSQLSLHLTAAERSNRRLSPETLLTAASMLDEHGVVRLCDALDDKVAEECARAVGGELRRMLTTAQITRRSTQRAVRLP